MTASIEVAVRTWAMGDPIAAAATERVEGNRIAVLCTLLADSGYAEQTARLLNLLVLGAGNVLASVLASGLAEQLPALRRRVLS